uniref:ATP synthase FO subunit 8 n=1 Tax=Vespula vulgaris TaxID=7454 RepID=A0A514LQN5_VESVU|nr:ATP synthase FO subunit 8 [Vespula vulgaris]QDI94124.1 ATP synthase FO subunit 8 [Vespula vulgaris]QDI94137.1 ATP synthase FO subunit 8 [Vespula vulgaris]QDI94150.1 ATP synthase FO subunit 8 [Vespula vulgaris]QDI94163.1 ATP synthase FO subunit 8 [Vespula vulgaris]
MPQLSPMNWFWLYLLAIFILFLIIIKINYFYKNLKLSNKSPSHLISQFKWKI